MLLNNRVYEYGLVGLVSLSYLIVSSSTQAQTITSDGSFPTQVQSSDNLNFEITGGSQVGDNLFHSFENFSVPENGSASFVNGDVQNIINRVTGSSISNIDGLIKASGDANVLLINPNGIIFDRNASLDIGGSFLATTASGIEFADGTFLSATDSQTTPILTVSVPIGLQFGETPGRIVNQSQATRLSPNSGREIPVGLEVQPDNTLALVGGELVIEGGIISAPESRIELGSVDSDSFVSLNEIEERLALGYEEVTSFQDIQLTEKARVDGSGATTGDIYVRGKKIAISDQSRIANSNLGINRGGIIDIEATESVELNDESQIINETFNSGSTENISVITRKLIVSNSSLINSRTGDEGEGGDIIVNASESVEINGNGLLTQITTQSLGSGKAGKIRITTGKLFLRDGGQATSSTFAQGNAGNVTIDATESIEISGQGENFDNEFVSSSIFSQTSGIFGANTGNGGNIEINTGRLNIQEGGSISVGSVNGSEGAAGTLNISALESVDITGSGSTLLAESGSSQPAGDLIINTNRLTVTDRGEVNVSATGTGVAGSLTINTQDITLDEGTLTAETNAGDLGNITITNENNLLLGNNSQITTNAQGTATGGDITINSDIIAAVNNSDITANAVEGAGGDITITAQLVGIEAREEESPNTNDITASSELGVDGTITIDNPKEDPLKSLLTVPSVPLDAARIFAQNVCKFEDGKIAKGSSFIITGRGGFVPTAADPIDDRDRVVNWAKREDIKVSEDGSVAVRQRSEQETLETSDRVIQQAQGLVIASDGTAWLTAESSNITLQNSGTDHPDCRS